MNMTSFVFIIPINDNSFNDVTENFLSIR